MTAPAPDPEKTATAAAKPGEPGHDAARASSAPVDAAEPAAKTLAKTLAKTPAKTPAQAPRPREIGGPKGPEPTRYGDWERNGRVSDF